MHDHFAEAKKSQAAKIKSVAGNTKNYEHASDKAAHRAKGYAPGGVIPMTGAAMQQAPVMAGPSVGADPAGMGPVGMGASSAGMAPAGMGASPAGMRPFKRGGALKRADGGKTDGGAPRLTAMGSPPRPPSDDDQARASGGRTKGKR